MAFMSAGRSLNSLVLLATFALAASMAGCSAHSRVYDPYQRDYHAWPAENGFYLQWETETHRDHRDFKHRNDEEQKQYWQWRHKQEQHHDNDSGRH